MFISLVLFTSTIFAISAATWWLWFKFSYFCQLVNQFPGPRPLPLIGNAVEILGGGHVLRKKIHEEWATTYGEAFRFFVGSKVYLVVSSPELIELIVNNPKLLGKGSDYDLMRPWLGLGLLTCSGAKWKSRRRLLTPAFHFRIMEDFFDTFNEQSSILCHKIDQLCQTNHNNGEIDMEKLTSLCTLDIICETAMGCKVNAQTQESEYVKAASSFSAILLDRMMTPWYHFDLIYNRTLAGKEYQRCLQILRSFTDEVIRTKKQEYLMSVNNNFIDKYGKQRKPFLDLLLETSKNGDVLSDDDISEEVNTFMFAGSDTTATTLQWFIYCMATNLSCQEKLREELFQVFDDSDRPCTRQDLTELKYLECCVKETLRLYPSVPVFLRIAPENLQIGDYQIPEGCNIAVSTYALHHNPRIYPDPYTYNPDRFLLEQSAGRHPYAFIPFSAGSRNCIGQRFAMAEEKVIISSLFRRFKFEESPIAAEPVPSMDLTLKSVNRIHLLVSCL